MTFIWHLYEINKLIDLSLLKKFQGEDYAGHGNSWIYLPFEVGTKKKTIVMTDQLRPVWKRLQASHYIAYRWGEARLVMGIFGEMMGF